MTAMSETVKCPHCKGARYQRSVYAPRPYPCEDCGGAGTLKVCAECQQPGGPHNFEEESDEVCGYCKADRNTTTNIAAWDWGDNK